MTTHSQANMKLNFYKIQNRLSELKKVNYTLEMLANDLKVSLKTIHNWKVGNFSPRLLDMEKIKDLCEFDSLDDLIE